MKATDLLLNPERLNRLFPFYILINENSLIESYGKSLQKICPGFDLQPIGNFIDVKRPLLEKADYPSLISLKNQLVVFDLLPVEKVSFRGQIEFLEESNQLLFIGSPWFGSMEQVKENNLNIHDFAFHDPLIDLLHVLKNQEITNDELKQVLATVNRQKNDLKVASEKLVVLSKIAEDNLNSVIITDKEGKITWVNKSFITLTGYSLEESLGKKPGHLLQGPDTEPSAIEYLRKQITDGHPFVAEIINYTKQKTPYWIRIQGQPIHNMTGELTGFFALEEDITREREINREIKETERRFLLALEKIGDNVWEHDFRTGTTTFSKSTNELLGVEFKEESSAAKIWWQSVHPDEIGKLIEQDRRYKLGEIDSHNTEYRLIQKSGAIKWVLDRGVVIERNDQRLPLRIVGTHTDITDIKQTEKDLENRVKQFKSLSENIPAVVYEYQFNKDGTEGFRYISPAIESVFGLSEEDFRKDAFSYLHPDDRKGFLAVNKKARDLHEPFFHESRLLIPGREMKWQAVSSSFSYFTENGDSVFTGIISDISDQKELEIRLVRAREEAERLAKTKESFLANMSHEIRTPLNGIIGMIRELNRMDLSTVQKLYVNNASTASQHLLSIINNILDLSKIEAGAFDLEKNSFNINQLFSEVEKIMRPAATEKMLGLEFTVSSNLASAFIGDALRIKQILLNIINNAIKFTDKGYVHLNCEANTPVNDTQHIVITVSDSGIGMEEVFLKTIFNKFSQENQTVQRKYGGTGLGMAITYELVHLLGGEISVTSQKGKGTQFNIGFTLTVDDNASVQSETNSIDYLASLSGKKVLVVEDNEMNRLVVSNLLDHYEVVTKEAIHGEYAIQMLTAEKFDIILMDLQMPVMDGLEATRLIRKQKISTPIIALTANAFKNEIDKCMQAGMNDFATKPFDEDILLKTIIKNLPKESESERTEPLELVVNSDKKLYDLSRLIAMSRGKEEFVKRMAKLFCDQIPDSLATLEDAVKSQDLSLVNRIAHRMKPSVAEMGIHSIKDEILYLETAATTNSSNEIIRIRAQKIINTLQVALEQLKADQYTL